ncbi:MAG: hypothetical protein B7Z33_04855 [Sphingomonadales bacterium 12-68-11]|nr:MAG: hypothetical protein B7Z33_04855 [Sphingomonadales bacterium 12-68-11]
MTGASIDLIQRGDPGYDAERARVIWNKRLDTARAPEAIVTVRSAEEAAAAVRYARERGLRVSPRSGGHHYEAAPLRDGGLLLDLGGLDFIEIDAEARTARVGAGVQGGALAEALAAHGLAFPVGHCVDVGLGGYLLAGGYGWNAGEWGAACANVIAIEAVTADGAVVLADDERHPDLVWAARGHGAGFFAAITAYHLRVFPVPGAIVAWRCAFTAASAPVLADWLTAAAAAAHPAVEIGCFLMDHWETGEPAIVLRLSACADDEAEAHARLASFASPPAAAEKIGEIRAEAVAFTDLFKMSPMPGGKRVAADHMWSDAPLGDLLRATWQLAAASPHSTVDLIGFGGGAPPAGPAHGALSVGGGTGAGIYAIWDDPADDAANRDWVRRIDAALAPLRTGRYVGEADLTAGPERRAECFTPETLERLEAIRTRYDPDRLFFAYPEG